MVKLFSVLLAISLTVSVWAETPQYMSVHSIIINNNNLVHSKLLNTPCLYPLNIIESILSDGSSFTHYIGELYGGGIIVSVWKINGIEHGLIASLTDISTSATWSNMTSKLIGTKAQSLRDGQANTTAIIEQVGHTLSAASLCKSHTGGGFNDWYLPATWELNQCYNAANIVNEVLGDVNGFKPSYYWTSTESYSSSAWHQYFTNGFTVYNDKNGTYNVRAVRRF